MNEELRAKLKFCRLSGIAEHYNHIVQEAQANEWSYDKFFENLIEQEVIVRENNRFDRLLKQAKCPTIKTIEQFDFYKKK